MTSQEACRLDRRFSMTQNRGFEQADFVWNDGEKWRLYFGGFDEYTGYNKECIQTNLDTEHKIKHRFGTISWLLSLYSC